MMLFAFDTPHDYYKKSEIVICAETLSHARAALEAHFRANVEQYSRLWNHGFKIHDIIDTGRPLNSTVYWNEGDDG